MVVTINKVHTQSYYSIRGTRWRMGRGDRMPVTRGRILFEGIETTADVLIWFPELRMESQSVSEAAPFPGACLCPLPLQSVGGAS